MTVQELVLKLKKFDQELNVTLDTFEGAEFLELDQVYEAEKGIVLYGSIFSCGSGENEF